MNRDNNPLSVIQNKAVHQKKKKKAQQYFDPQNTLWL